MKRPIKIKMIVILERLFYLALPPSVSLLFVKKLKNVYPPEESKGKLRIIIEKPFGRDLDTYREMQKKFPIIY